MLYEMNHLTSSKVLKFMGQDVLKMQNTVLSQGLIEINCFNVCNALFQS